jgi:hypothetical protein
MSKAKEAKKASRKKTEEEDDDDDEDDTEKSSAKKANNVIVGTLGEVKAGGEGEPPSPGAAAAGDKKYAYRDFSQIPEEDFDVDYEIDQEGLLQVSNRARQSILLRPLVQRDADTLCLDRLICARSGPGRIYYVGSGTNHATDVAYTVQFPSATHYEGFRVGSFSKIPRQVVRVIEPTELGPSHQLDASWAVLEGSQATNV